jgi:hypothetical protein
MKITRKQLKRIIKEELLKAPIISEGMSLHIRKNVGVDKNIFRPGSSAFFALFREARQLYTEGKYNATDAELELLEDMDIGEFGVTESGEVVPIDYPMIDGEYDIDEATYKGKKVKLNDPKRSDGKAYVYVKTKKKDKKGRYKVKKVTFGSSMPDAMGDSDAHKKRRKSFGDRHNCADKKDKTKPGWWSCRATKFFGRSVPGWW